MNAVMRTKHMMVVGVLAFLMSVPSALADEREKVCEGVSVIAHEVMMRRQEGIPLQDVLRDFNSGNEGRTDKKSQDARDGLRRMVVRAYSQPRFFGEDFQKRAARDFADGYMVACLS